LWVDPKVHAAEVARFRSKIVSGPGEEDCSIWIGSIGADGYGRRPAEGIAHVSNKYPLPANRDGCAKRRPAATGEIGSRRACVCTPSNYVPDAIVSEHADKGCNGYQLGVIAVKVDLNQVAALPVEDACGKQSAVTALLQHFYFGGIRARHIDPCDEGAALGERLSCGRYSASG